MQKILKLLSSVKFTIVLFIIIALSSLIGTLIIQEQGPDVLQQKYGDFLYKIFSFLGFFDLYHSWWFIFILILFSLNIIVCTLSKFSLFYKQAFKPEVNVDDKYLENLKNSTKIKIATSYDKAKSDLIKYLRKKGYGIRESKTAQVNECFLAYKGAWSRFSVLIVHISFLLILCGALIGSIFGFKGYVEIDEGTCVNYFYNNQNQKIELPFMIFLKKFTVEFYEDKNIPKSFISEVEIKETCSGEPILTKTIEVNHPLSFRDITFYQSSYGFSENPSALTLNILKNNVNIASLTTSLNKEETIYNIGYRIKVIHFIPDFAIDEKMQIYSKSKEPNNPAIFVQVTDKNNRIEQFWTFQKFPEFHKPKNLPFTLKLVDFKQGFYSGLQVVKDPGVIFVYSGFILILIGLFLSLCFYYRRIWFKFKDNELIVAGISNKNPFSFSEEYQKIISEIKSIT